MRSEDLERALERIYLECGYAVERQTHVPEWDRWRCHCATCDVKSWSWLPPTGPCSTCGSAVASFREEAVLDLDVRSAEVPRAYIDVTVRHSVPADGPRLAAAANRDGAVAAEGEADKRRRYPDGRTPWRVLPFAVESYGRFGLSARKVLKDLAKKRAQRVEEGSDEAASTLMVRWAARLSVALHRSNARRLRSALGDCGTAVELHGDLAG